MSVDLNATCRAAEMSSILSTAGSSLHIFIYSGTAPSKTAAPTGTSAITGGIACSSTPFTQGTDGTDANTKLTLAGVPLSGTATASITPGYYRLVIGATDNGSYTLIQDTAGVGSGDLNFSSTISSGGTITISSLTYTEGNV